MRYSIIFIFLLLQSTIVLTQNRAKIDSLHVIISQETDSEQIARNYIKIGNMYRRVTKADSAMIYANKALDHALTSEKPEIIAYTYLFMGAIQYYLWNMGDAINYYQKTDSTLTSHGIRNKHLLISYMDRAQLFTRAKTLKNEIESYEKSRFYHQKALTLAKELKDSSKIGRTLMSLAHCEKNLNNPDKAVLYLKEVKTDYLDHVSTGDYHVTYASVLLKKSDTIAYLKQSKLAYDIRKGTKSNFQRAIAQWTYSRALYVKKDYRESIDLAQQSADYFSKLDPPDYGRLSSLYTSLSRSYRKLNQHKKAFEYVALYEAVNDSLASNSLKEKGIELETKFQAERKEQEIALLQAQNETAEAKRKNQRNILLGGIGLTSLAGIFLLLGYRNRKKTNDKLRELDGMKSSFFANISHEFRTPLSLIAGPIEEQLKKSHIDDKEKKNLETAQRNSQRLVTLVDQLLDLSKLEAGHFMLRVQKSELGTFLKGIASSFEYAAAAKSCSYSSQIHIDNDHCFDRDMIEKITTNLIGNAIKYSPEEAEIQVKASVVDNRLKLSVRNTGTALNDDQLSNIFNRFYRANEEQVGSGIGLAHTKELVALHKGFISASSDKGWTTFEVNLPVSEAAFTDIEKKRIGEDNLKTPAFAKAQQAQNPSIEDKEVHLDRLQNNQPILLIVDDNEDLRNYVSSLFQDQFTIITEKNGKEGYAKALEVVPDVIITDLMMPEEDGLTFTKNCKTNKATSHIPIMMLTAKAGDENELVGIETGADAYLTKPFSTEILKATVHNLQESRRILQERFSQEVVLLPKDIATNSIDEKFLENLQEVMDQKLVESDFNTEAFAQAVGMSRMQLHRKLKALTGLSSTEFIRNQRLKLAAQLLKKSEINVSQVGYTVGFNNHSYFTKCFKEQYGCSPSEYIKKF